MDKGGCLFCIQTDILLPLTYYSYIWPKDEPVATATDSCITLFLLFTMYVHPTFHVILTFFARHLHIFCIFQLHWNHFNIGAFKTLHICPPGYGSHPSTFGTNIQFYHCESLAELSAPPSPELLLFCCVPFPKKSS